MIANIQHFYRHSDVPVCSVVEGPLRGLRHRTVIDHATGASQLALWQEEHDSGFEVPLHWHDCEEIITVLDGEIEGRIGHRTWRIGPLESILIPPHAPHGFRVTSAGPVRLLALFSSSDPKIYRMDGKESCPPWMGGSSDHLTVTT